MQACSTFKLQKGNALLYGHNLNQPGMDVPGMVFINKRGVFKVGRSWSEMITPERSKPSTSSWISRYGSVTFSTFGRDMPDGGVNEAGLYIWEMNDDTEYPKNDSLPKLVQMNWMQYVLDNFATLDEAVASASEFEIDGWGWHFFVGDAQGRCAAVEFIKGKLVVQIDKANRTSVASFRGPGIDAGLEILAAVKREIGVPVVTDVHEPGQVAAVAEVVDIMQTPAFLCRQTDFIRTVAAAGKPVNLKKGQFLSPWEMRSVVEKAAATGNTQLMVTERGFAFGYQNLVADMRSIPIMRSFGCPVVFDATHSLQLPGAGKGHSGGQPQFIFPMARAAVAAGVQAIFLETHPCVEQALCDAANMLPLQRLRELLIQLKDIDSLTKHLSN